jgi:hypothetical protein
LRVALVLITLLLAGVVVDASAAAAPAACPTQTFLSYNHLAYEGTAIPSTVAIPSGTQLGSGTIDEPTNANGCRRADKSVTVQAAGSIQPQVALRASGRPRELFVVGHRCQGFAGSAYWDCLLHPLVFDGHLYTGTGYPLSRGPRKTLPTGSALGTAQYQGHKVMVSRLQGIAPALAIAISGQPSAAFLTARTCPYSGFANNPQYDNLLRCLHSPVWFTFDPPGNAVGGTVTGRSDRTLSAAVSGATISLVSVPIVADYVPAHHGSPLAVGHVADQVSVKVPNVPAGVYEAVVTCLRCAPQTGAGGTLYPAGSILITAEQHSSPGIQIISYVLAALVVLAATLSIRTYRRRRRTMG